VEGFDGCCGSISEAAEEKEKTAEDAGSRHKSLRAPICRLNLYLAFVSENAKHFILGRSLALG
jgi:hypothetical protein